MRAWLLVLLLSVTLSMSSFLPSASVKGRRMWTKGERLSSSDQVQIILALRQRNMDTVKNLVLEVSNPQSAKYGKYLSLGEIADMVAPSQGSIDKVMNWAHSLNPSRVNLTLSRDFIGLIAPAVNVEKALGIRLHSFKHQHSGRVLYRTLDPVKLPQEVAEEVEVVVGLTDFFDYNSERKLARKNLVDPIHQNQKRMVLQNATSAPEIVSPIRGSESEATIRVRIYCLDGRPATTLPACGGGNNAKTVAVNVIYADGDTTQLSTEIDNFSCDTSTGTVICMLHTTVRQYQRINVTAITRFVSGAISAVGSYLTTFSPAPWVTPQLVNQMYNIPQGWRGTHPNNSQSVVGFEEQYISFTDLQQFFLASGLPQQIPTVVGKNDPTNPGGESTLDIQWVMAIGAGVPTTFWSVTGPGPVKGGGAYILTWAYEIGNTTNPPLVTSISYGDTEQGFYDKFGNYDYIDRMNDELAKMALRGLTVIAGSGDAGASNVGEDGNDISDTDPTCTPMRPFFPSNSPYVVSVSATFFSTYSVPVCLNQKYLGYNLVCSQLGEVAVSVRQGTHWTTGGGFSNLTLTPAWQKAQVQQFLSLSAGSLPPSQFWNSSGRGYPDVSTVGFNLFVILNGEIVSIGGTSASGPILAGIFALLNDQRLQNGKSPLGLVTPTLYYLQSLGIGAFRDVVVGENFDGDIQARNSPYPTYCPYGFMTKPGWDAVTGLGTPNFGILNMYV